ncbi:MAG TPA: redoxin domain-containing protein [Pyrinomonadaceae bacterium]|nr:redoxin domain-containing protein [Pyrinomonadaceae bacterium]
MNHKVIVPHRRRLRTIFTLSIGVILVGIIWLEPTRCISGTAYSVHAQDDAFAYETEYQKGIDLLRRRQYEDALKSFKRANEMRGKKSPEALLGMAQSYMGLEAYKNVIDTAEKVLELEPNNAEFRAQAYNYKGLALQSQADMKDEKKLREAEAALREGLALNVPELKVLRHNLGVVLLKQGRDAEGIAELQNYLKLQPTGGYSDTARRMIENPRRAREYFAPDFSIITSEGEHITLDDLRGKVIVLDFWGTWCPPCVASIPSLRALHKKFSKEPQFVLIGISSDSDEDVWREFTTKEKMIWPQFWDRNRQVQRAFNVRAFPTYIVIDHEGIVRFRSIGTSWDRTASLNDVIKKQVKIVAKTDAVNQP